MSEPAAWLLTYLLHSTVLLALAWIGDRLFGGRRLAARELLWRIALLGALVTPSVQLALGWSSPIAAFRLAPAVSAASLEARPAPAALSGAERTRAREVRPRRLADPAPAPSGAAVVRSTAPASAIAGPAASASTPGRPWTAWLVAAWLAGALALLARLGLSWWRLGRRLRGRLELLAGPLVELLRRLAAAASRRREVRLTTSARLEVPIARGLRRQEICLPDRVERDFGPEEQETILAHELAHLERRDPLWLVAYRLIECLLFVQPLNFVASRELRRISEYRCDDRAVAATGRPISLARVLTRVADWRLPAALPVPSMAASRSTLGSRVRRLVDRGYPHPEEPRPGWLKLAAVAALVLVVAAAPGVSRDGSEAAPEAPPAPESAESAPAPEAPESPQAPADRAAPTAPAAPSGAGAPSGPALAPAAPTSARGAKPEIAPAAPTSDPAAKPEIAPAPPTPAPAAKPALAPAAVPPARPAPGSAPRIAPAPSPTVGPALAPAPIARVALVAGPAPAGIAGPRTGDPDPEVAREAELEALEEEIEAQMEDLEEWIEESMEGAFDELEDAIDEEIELGEEELERLEEELEAEIEAFEEEMEAEIEALEDDLERAEEEVEGRMRSTGRADGLGRMEAEFEAFEHRIEAFEDRMDAEIERLEARVEHRLVSRYHAGHARRWEEMGRLTAAQGERVARMSEQIARLSAEIARQAEVGAGEHAELAEIVRRTVEVRMRLEGETDLAPDARAELERTIARLGEEREALRQRMVEKHRLTEEQRTRLREEARRLAEEARPTRDEIERMRAEARRVAAEALPRAEEIEASRQEIRTELEALRSRFRGELESHRAELEALRLRDR